MRRRMRRRRWRQRRRCLAAAAPAAGAPTAGTALRLRGGVKGDVEGRVGVEADDDEFMTTGRLCGVDGSAWCGLDGMWMRRDEGSRTGRGGSSVAAASGEAAEAAGIWWWCI